MSESHPIIDTTDKRHQRRDLRMVARAIRRGWDVPKAARCEIMASINTLVAREDTSCRVLVACGLVLVEADLHNLKAEAKALATFAEAGPVIQLPAKEPGD